MENLQKVLKAAEGKPKKQEFISNVISDLSDDGVLDMAFPRVSYYAKAEQEAAAVKRLSVTKAPARPISVAPGGKLVDPVTGAEIATGGKKEPTPEQPTLKKQREFKSKKEIAETRDKIITNKDNTAVQSYIPLYNTSQGSEVAYWDSDSFDEEATILKLSQEAKAAGWTPAKIQEQADLRGMTVFEALKDIGVLD